jgi:hypothetical protein
MKKGDIMREQKVICEYCGSETYQDDIEECIECGKDTCHSCRDLDVAAVYGIYAHDFHECDGNSDCCESRICYNDNCKHWNKKDHWGKSKSEWDEELAFRASLDPNDPADAWFFED